MRLTAARRHHYPDQNDDSANDAFRHHPANHEGTSMYGGGAEPEFNSELHENRRKHRQAGAQKIGRSLNLMI